MGAAATRRLRRAGRCRRLASREVVGAEEGHPDKVRRGEVVGAEAARPPNDDDEDPRSADDDDKDEDNEEDDDEEDPPPVAVKVVWTSKRTRTMARKRGSRVVPAWLTCRTRGASEGRVSRRGEGT